MSETVTPVAAQDRTPLLGWLRISGDSRALGQALGRQGREAVHRHLLPSAIWARITDPGHAPHLARMAATTRTHFPAIWAEIEGLAEGLALPVDQVFAWNCRGDLLAAVPDGCTTLQLPGETPVIAHNEDGLPFFRGHCFIAEAAPAQGAGFISFCYPGSIPGHTFAVARTEAGGEMVQAVNNLRLTGIAPEIPRMVLGRAVIAMGSVTEAVALLRAAPPSGGFHFTLAEAGNPEVLSIEFGGGQASTRTVTAPALHANHALHHPGGLAAQIVTASSHDRQARGEALLTQGMRDPLGVLHDDGGPGLPILRQSPDDPDDENTLATAVFHVGRDGVSWAIHDRPGGRTAYVRSAPGK